MRKYNKEVVSISYVNNYKSKKYPQKTIKNRVISFLNNMIEAGY
jgi:hypothetical protein